MTSETILITKRIIVAYFVATNLLVTLSIEAEAPKVALDTQLPSLQQEDLNGPDWHPLIKHLQSLFDPLDKVAVSRHIHYPISVKYPLEIRNEAEMLEHWDLLFDEALVSRIAESQPSDWDKVGWRGVMLDNGAVWVADGSGKIIATNYTTQRAQQLFEAFTENLKKRLHPSVSKYSKSKMDMFSTKYRLRMDWLDDKVLRLALWESGQDISSKPQVVIESDEWRIEGSGGYIYATFRKNGHRYEYTPYGKHQPMLSIYSGENLIYQEEYVNVSFNLH